jgi:hypothetical protein
MPFTLRLNGRPVALVFAAPGAYFLAEIGTLPRALAP